MEAGAPAIVPVMTGLIVTCCTFASMCFSTLPALD
jgi:predicted exporter